LDKLWIILLMFWVQFPDGSICIVQKANSELVPSEAQFNHIKEIRYDFYPSQGVSNEKNLFKTSVWIQGTYKHQTHGTVIHAEVSEVEVEWICEYGESSNIPGPFWSPNELKVVDHFQHLYSQLGEHVICPPELRLLKNEYINQMEKQQMEKQSNGETTNGETTNGEQQTEQQQQKNEKEENKIEKQGKIEDNHKIKKRKMKNLHISKGKVKKI